MRSRATLALAFLLLVAAPSAHAAGGPVIGIDSPGGIVAPGGSSRYLALHGARGDTVVARLSLPGGKLVRQRAVKGDYLTPAVAYDGSTSGVSADARKLVLIEAQTRLPVRTTRLLVLSALPLRVEKRIALRGMYGFDAISPDGSTIYLVRYTAPRQDLTRYEVRALDATTGRLLPGAIVDPREPDEKMTGNPVTRATSPDGRWAYTLYAAADGTPFIHALDTTGRKAYCIDLDALARQPDLFNLHLRVQQGGDRLAVVRGSASLELVDTKTLRVSEPPALTAPAPKPPAPDTGAEDGGTPWALWAAIAIVLLAVAGGLGLRSRARALRAAR